MKQMIFLAAFIGLLGCGPEKPAKEREDDNIRENVERKTQELSALAGKYVGTLTLKKNEERLPVSFVLVQVSQVLSSPSRNDVIVVPTLAGTVQRPSAYKEEDFTVVAWFSTAEFDPQTGKLRLSGSSPVQLGAVTAYFALDAQVVSDGHIVGKYSSTVSSEGEVGILDVQKQ